MSSDSRIEGRIASRRECDSSTSDSGDAQLVHHTPEIIIIHKVATIVANHTPGTPSDSFMRAAQL